MTLILIFNVKRVEFHRCCRKSWTEKRTCCSGLQRNLRIQIPARSFSGSSVFMSNVLNFIVFAAYSVCLWTWVSPNILVILFLTASLIGVSVSFIERGVLEQCVRRELSVDDHYNPLFTLCYLTVGWTDGWMDGRADGWTDGRTDGRTDERTTDGRMGEEIDGQTNG